jgi:hypothetical protein
MSAFVVWRRGSLGQCGDGGAFGFRDNRHRRQMPRGGLAACGKARKYKPQADYPWLSSVVWTS